MNSINSHSRAAVYSDCCTTSNVSVTTCASHPVDPPTICRFDVSVLNAKKSSVTVSDSIIVIAMENKGYEYGRTELTEVVSG